MQHHRDALRRQACILVKKCLNNMTIYDFNIYFQYNAHSFGTRNQEKLVNLQKVRLEVAHSSFFFMGARVLNSPLEIGEWVIFYSF